MTTFRKTLAGIAAVAAIATMAGCSSGSSTHPGTSSSASTTTTSSGPVNATEAAVLNAWESAEQTLYGYQQKPWQQDRANLVAGETSADLWPNLADYFTGTALQTQTEFLVKTKMGEVNGPTTYNLGRPVVRTFAQQAATVTSCIYDTGTTTASGQPAPANLGGGAGSYSGTWDLQLMSGTWKIASFQTTTVSKC